MPNVFDQFDAPAQPSGNVFDQFDQPAAGPAPSSSDLGTTAFWNKPANASWSDYLLAHLTKPFENTGQAAQDYARSIGNAATFGTGDRMLAYLSGTPLAQERAETSTARGRLGPTMSTLADAVPYALGGQLGIAAKLGGGVLGGAGEMGLAGAAAGAGGGNQDLLSRESLFRAVTGGVAGTVAGGAAGLVSKALDPLANAASNAYGRAIGALVSPGAAVNATADLKDAAYKALQAPEYDKGDINAVLNQAGTDFWNGPGKTVTAANIPGTQKVLADLGQKMAASKTVDAGTINDAIRDLGDVKGYGPTGADNTTAPWFADRLQSVFDNLPTTTGHSPAEVNAMVDNAKGAYKNWANARDLQSMGQDLKFKSPTPLAAKIAQTYYQPSAPSFAEGPQYNALANIAGAGESGISPYGAMHAMSPLIDAGAAGLGGMVGGPAGAIVGEHLGGALNYAVLKPAAGAALGAMAKRAKQTAINQAFPVLTGQSVQFPRVSTSPALLSLLYGGPGRFTP